MSPVKLFQILYRCLRKPFGKHFIIGLQKTRGTDHDLIDFLFKILSPLHASMIQ